MAGELWTPIASMAGVLLGGGLTFFTQRTTQRATERSEERKAGTRRRANRRTPRTVQVGFSRRRPSQPWIKCMRRAPEAGPQGKFRLMSATNARVLTGHESSAHACRTGCAATVSGGGIAVSPSTARPSSGKTVTRCFCAVTSATGSGKRCREPGTGNEGRSPRSPEAAVVRDQGRREADRHRDGR
jgi:hypothetical protein